MDEYLARRVEKVPLPKPIPSPKKSRFRETTRFYQFALFLIPLGTLLIGIGIIIPHWLDVLTVNFVTIVKDYNEGLWERCDKNTCVKREDSTLKGYEMTVRVLELLGIVTCVAACVLIVLCVFVRIVSEKTIVHVITSALSYLASFLCLLGIIIFAGESRVSRAYTLSYSFYLILFGSVSVLSSAILINVYVYRKWKSRKRRPAFSRDDISVQRENDYREGSSKHEPSEDDFSKHSDNFSKHSDSFSKQSDNLSRQSDNFPKESDF